MREEQASMTRLSPYYFFRDGRAHIYRHLSKWVVSAFLLPGVTRFPVYNVGEVRFRYSYLERFAFGEASYPIGYRRDPTATAAWSEIIRSLALIAGGDLYYECLENDSEQPIFKSRFLMKPHRYKSTAQTNGQANNRYMLAIAMGSCKTKSPCSSYESCALF